jgi:hypothetical protein
LTNTGSIEKAEIIEKSSKVFPVLLVPRLRGMN